jgi:hypothetical protein
MAYTDVYAIVANEASPGVKNATESQNLHE